MGRKAVESIGLILTIVGPLNGSDAVTAYLTVAVLAALDPGPILDGTWLHYFINRAVQMYNELYISSSTTSSLI